MTRAFYLFFVSLGQMRWRSRIAKQRPHPLPHLHPYTDVKTLMQLRSLTRRVRSLYQYLAAAKGAWTRRSLTAAWVWVWKKGVKSGCGFSSQEAEASLIQRHRGDSPILLLLLLGFVTGRRCNRITGLAPARGLCGSTDT